MVTWSSRGGLRSCHRLVWLHGELLKASLGNNVGLASRPHRFSHTSPTWYAFLKGKARRHFGSALSFSVPPPLRSRNFDHSCLCFGFDLVISFSVGGFWISISEGTREDFCWFPFGACNGGMEALIEVDLGF